MSPDLRDLIPDDVPDDERARLQRVHELLLAAGPPPELPPELVQVPLPEDERVVPFLPRRRRGFSLAVAATVGVLAFFAGVLWNQQQNAFDARATVHMHAVAGGPEALGSIDIGHADASHNWPMLVRVRGLKPLAEPAYYTLWLSRNGKPIAPCGSFNTRSNDKTEIRLEVPYRLKRFDGWVVTLVQDPRKDRHGVVVMTT